MDYEKKLAASLGVPFRIQTCNIRNFRINYLVAGFGKPVLLIHGVNTGWGEWHTVIGALAKHCTVFALDLPGAGGSTKVDFRFVDFEADFVGTVTEFIRQNGIERPAVIGHSAGGWIAARLVLSGVPVSQLILVDSLGFTDYIPLKYKPLVLYSLALLLSKTVMRPTRKNMEKFLTDVLYKPDAIREDFVDYFHQAVVREPVTHPFLFIHRLFTPFHIRNEFVFGDAVRRIGCPTLIISGDRDPLIPFKKSALAFRGISNADIKIFRDTGHAPFLERPEEFNVAVLSFLR